MGIIRKTVRATTTLGVGVPLAKKHGKKERTARAAEAMVDELRQQRTAGPPPSAPAYVPTSPPHLPPPQPAHNVTIAEDLAKLADLRTAGAISEAEFETAKARLLA